MMARVPYVRISQSALVNRGAGASLKETIAMGVTYLQSFQSFYLKLR